MRWPTPIDAGFAGVLTAVGLLEIGVDRLGTDRPGPMLLTVLAAGAAMLVRTRSPLLCLLLYVAIVVAVQVPASGQRNLTASVMVGTLVALGTVGRRCANRASVAALIATVTILATAAVFGERPWDAMLWLGCTAFWGTGRLMRRDAQHTRKLAALAAELGAEREARAREAVELDRARIARDLHDAVAHTVSVMTIQAAGVRRRLDPIPDRARERDVLLEVERLGRQAVVELHDAVGMPRVGTGPVDGTTAGPAPGAMPRLDQLDQLTARVRAAGVPVDVRVTGTPRPLPAVLDRAAYRIIQEALTNTLRHANATRVVVEVGYDPDGLVIAVLDDGAGDGSPPAENRGPRHGLAGMRERAALFGGTVEAGTHGRRGFAVRASLPMTGVGDE